MNKTILITGLSGSGKTTLSNKFSQLGYNIIHLDEISKYYQKGRPIENDIIRHFVIDINRDINFYAIWEQDNYLIINSFIKYVTQLEGKYVIEGIHLIMPYIDRCYLLDYDIIIMNTSSREAMIRRLKRGIKNDVPLKIKIKNIIKYDLSPTWILDDIIFRKFKRYMRKRNKELVVI